MEGREWLRARLPWMVCDIRRAIENQVREPFSESRQMGLWRTAYRNQHVEEESSHGRRGGRTVFQLFASSTQSLSIHRIPFLHYLSAQREHSLLMNALLCFLGQCSILTTPTAIRDASTSSGSILLKRIAPNTLFSALNRPDSLYRTTPAPFKGYSRSTNVHVCSVR